MVSAKQDVICSGQYYFTVRYDGSVQVTAPPSNIICDVIFGSLSIYKYNASYEKFVPPSLKSVKTINGTLVLQQVSDYPTFFNSLTQIGSLNLYSNQFNNTWTFKEVKRIFDGLSVYDTQKVRLSFPNLVELKEIEISQSTFSVLDLPLLVESGSIKIYYWSASNPLIGLNKVKKIKGDLELYGSSLSSLGMDSLTSITGNIVNEFNDGQTNITFPNGIDIGGNIVIRNCDYDVTMKALKAPVFIHGSLDIYDNYELVDLRGLGKAIIGDSINIFNNEGEVYLFDVSDITSINGSIDIYGNKHMDYLKFPSLQTIQGMLPIPQSMKQSDSLDIYYPVLKSVQGVVLVYHCNSLVNLNSIKSIQYIGSLYVEDNKKMISLEGLEQINILKSLDIQNNESLKSLKGLSNLVNFDGYLHIGNNEKISSLDGLNNMKSVGSLSIEYNKNLKSLQGLNNVETVYGVVSITNNNRLASLDGLNNLNSVASLGIGFNNRLKSLTGLDELIKINGTLSINDNKKLTTTEGINKLEYVKSIEINMSNQRKIKEIVFGSKGNNLGYPEVGIYDVSRAKKMSMNDIKRSFSSICKVINSSDKSLFTCNKSQ